MSPKTTPKIVQNEPREWTALETPPGGSRKPQNLIKPTKNTPGGTCGARRTESAKCRVAIYMQLSSVLKRFWQCLLHLLLLLSWFIFHVSHSRTDSTSSLFHGLRCMYSHHAFDAYVHCLSLSEINNARNTNAKQNEPLNASHRISIRSFVTLLSLSVFVVCMNGDKCSYILDQVESRFHHRWPQKYARQYVLKLTMSYNWQKQHTQRIIITNACKETKHFR